MKEIAKKVIPVSLTVGYPETDEELEAMFRLRTKVYTELGYTTARDDKDQYDLNNKSAYFIAKINEKLVGTSRVVVDDPLPTELYFDFEVPKKIALIPRKKRCEISRLTVMAKGMNHLVALNLIKAMIEWAKESDCRGGYSSIIKGNLDQILSSIGFPFHPISSATLKYDGDLLRNYFYKGGKVLPIYYLRNESAEFMEKMKL